MVAWLVERDDYSRSRCRLMCEQWLTQLVEGELKTVGVFVLGGNESIGSCGGGDMGI